MISEAVLFIGQHVRSERGLSGKYGKWRGKIPVLNIGGLFFAEDC